MKPRIDDTSFGRITIDGDVYSHDVIITAGGEVTRRRRDLSKKVTGTSHIVSQVEAEYLLELGAKRLIIGSGQYGALHLSDEAEAFLRKAGCAVTVAPTPQAIEAYNIAAEPVTALFHLTC